MALTVRERNRSAVEKLTYQPVTAAQQAKIDAMRKSAQQFAKVVIKNTEAGPESTLAQRHIEDALQRANRSVLFEKPVGNEILDEVHKRTAKKTVARKVTAAPKKAVKRKTA